MPSASTSGERWPQAEWRRRGCATRSPARRTDALRARRPVAVLLAVLRPVPSLRGGRRTKQAPRALNLTVQRRGVGPSMVGTFSFTDYLCAAIDGKVAAPTACGPSSDCARFHRCGRAHAACVNADENWPSSNLRWQLGGGKGAQARLRRQEFTQNTPDVNSVISARGGNRGVRRSQYSSRSAGQALG